MWLLITYKMSQFPSASTKSSQNNHSSTNSFNNHFPLSPDCGAIAKDGCRPHQLPHSFLSPPVKSSSANFGSYSSSDAIIASGNLPASALSAGVAKMTVGSKFEDIPGGPIVPLLQPPLENFRSVCSAIPSTSISLDGIVDADYGGETQRLRLRQCSGNGSSVSGFGESVFAGKPLSVGNFAEINHNHSDKTEDVSDSLLTPRSDSDSLVDRRTCTSNHTNIVDTSENSHTSSSDGSSDLSSMSPTSTETPNSLSEQQHPPYSSAVRIFSGMSGGDKSCASDGDHRHPTIHNLAQMSSFSSISQNRSPSPSPGLLQTGYSVNSSTVIDSMLKSQLPTPSGLHDGIVFCTNSFVGSSVTTTLAPSMAVISPKLSVNDRHIYSTATSSESKFGSCSPLDISSYEHESRSRSPLAVDDAAEALLFLASQSTSQPSGISSFPAGSFGKLNNTTVTFGTIPFSPVTRIQGIQHVSVAGTHNPHFHSTLTSGHPSAGSRPEPTSIEAETSQIIVSSAAQQASLATSLFLQSTAGITDENDLIEGTEFPPSNASATFSLVADDVMNEDGFPTSASSLGGDVAPSVGVDSPSHVPLLSSGGDFGALLSDVSDIQSFSWPDGDLPPVVPLVGIQPPPSSDSLAQVVSLASSPSTQLPPSCIAATDQPPSMVSYLDGGGNNSLYPISPLKPPAGVSSPVKVLPSLAPFVGVKPSPEYELSSEPASKRFRSDLWRGFSTELSGDSFLRAQRDSAKGSTALPGEVLMANSMGLSPAKATVTISGRKLTLIQSVDVQSSASPTSKKDLVSLAEVYRAFYCAKLSLAEFRSHVVDRFGLELANGRLVNGLGRSEKVDALSINQIYSLLSKLKQSDRPSSIKGDLNCLKSTSNDSKFASELNKGNVRPSAKSNKFEKGAGRESDPNPSTSMSYSSIVTRITTQKDIFLIDYLGKTLPAIMVEGVEWTRLVDVEQVMFQPETSKSNAVVGGQVDHMKKTCARLGLEVEKCKANEKARLVVYANSVRHGSLHVVKATDLPRLLEAENKRRGLDRSHAPAESTSKYVGKKDRLKPIIASQRLSISSAEDSSGSDTDFGNDNENNGTSSSNSGSEISDSDLPPVVTDLPTGEFNRMSPDIVSKPYSKLAETPGKHRSSIKSSSSRRLPKKRRLANSLSSSSSDWSDSVTDSSDNEYDQGSRPKSLYNSPSGSSLVMKASDGHKSERLSPPPPPPKLKPMATKHGSQISKNSLNLPKSNSSQRSELKKSDLSSLTPKASESGEIRNRAKESDYFSKAPARSPVIVKPDLFVKQNEDIALGLVLEVARGMCRMAGSSPNSGHIPPAPGRPTSDWPVPEVSVGVSVPLHLIVCNNRGQRGPVGKYFNNLFQSRMSDCILCCSCRQFWPVGDFLRHNHTIDGIAIEEARLLMYVDNPSTARFDLWSRFVVKLRRFRYKRQVYDLPADLSEFYERFSVAEAMKHFADSRVADPVVADSSRPSTSNSVQVSVCNNSSDRLLEQSVGTSDSTPAENTLLGKFCFKKPPPVLPLKLPKRKKPRGDAGQLVARRLENRRVNLEGYRAMADGVIGLGQSEREAVIDDWFR